jgi:hypothetical protein
VGYEDGSWECLALDLPLSRSDGRPSDEALSRARILHVQPPGAAATPTRKITDVRFAPERYLALASADAVVYAYTGLESPPDDH